MKRRILFAINPVAGTRRKHRIPDKINRFLDTSRYEYEIIYTQGRGHATEIAAQAASDGYDALAIAGGDGSVNEAAQGLLGTETALAILPFGSGNGLARHLGYSSWVKSTLDVINSFHESRVDVGKVNGKYFFSLVGIGFDAFVAKIFDRVKGRGFTTYAMASAAGLMRFKDFEYKLETDTKMLEGKAFMIDIFNANQYGYNVKGAPDASVLDGQFHVVLVESYPRWRAPRLLYQLFTEQAAKSPYIRTFKARKIHVQATDRAYLQVDGEAKGKARDFNIELEPGALKMLVNPSAHL